jgi:hypothetical protein
MSADPVKPLHLALLLGVACAVSAILVFPYVVAMFPQLAHAKWPLWAIAGAQSLQAGVLCFLLAWAGLRLGRELDLGAPLLQRTQKAPRNFPTTILIGLATGALMVALDRRVFMPRQPAAIRELGAHLAPWKGLLASFYGGIAEEVQLRLFLMTLVAWLLSKLGGRHPWVYVVAALIAAGAFGAGHLPAATT